MPRREPEQRLTDILYGFEDLHQRYRAQLVDDHFDRGELVRLLGEKLNDPQIRERQQDGKDARLSNRDLAIVLVNIADYQDAINRLSEQLNREAAADGEHAPDA